MLMAMLPTPNPFDFSVCKRCLRMNVKRLWTAMSVCNSYRAGQGGEAELCFKWTTLCDLTSNHVWMKAVFALSGSVSQKHSIRCSAIQQALWWKYTWTCIRHLLVLMLWWAFKSTLSQENMTMGAKNKGRGSLKGEINWRVREGLKARAELWEEEEVEETEREKVGGRRGWERTCSVVD